MKVDSIRANNDFLITLLERNPHGLTFKEIAREWQRANMNGDNKPLTISTFKRRLTDIQSICQVKYVNLVYKIISSHIPDTNRLREWGISVQAIKAKLRDCEDLSNRIIKAYFNVLNVLGKGLAEKVYENALCIEFEEMGISYVRQMPLPVEYKGHYIGNYVADIYVDDKIIL
jgi:hypothetical protein